MRAKSGSQLTGIPKEEILCEISRFYCKHFRLTSQESPLFFVEANSFEKLTLWVDWHTIFPWEDVGIGYAPVIGKCGGYPVVVQFFSSRIAKRFICFYEATSRVVDYNLVEDCINSLAPSWDGPAHRVAKCSAINFHLCIEAVKSTMTQKEIDQIDKLLKIISARKQAVQNYAAC